MGNIKVTLDGGLHNDYGIFNLDASKLSNIKIDIITNGGQYVESQEANYQHGSTSGLRDHEGIKPIDSASPNWTNYGPVLATKLAHYFEDLIDSMATEELWDNYSIYGNQFSIEFDKTEANQDDTPDPEYENSNRSYISYTNEGRSFDGRTYKTYNLSDLYTSGTELKAYIIHFSKYYYVYNSVSGSQQTLRPLLYYTSDLEKYNMGIYEETPQGTQESIGIPYVNTLIGLEWYRHKSGWHRCEETYHTIRSFSAEARVNANITGGYGEASVICADEDSSGSGHDYSQFATNPNNRPTFENFNTKGWSSVPEGFSLWGIGGSHEYYICSNNQSKLDDIVKLPNLYLSTFNPEGKKRRRTSQDGGHVHSSQGGQDSFIGIMYRSDKNSNHHLFNTYFPVWGNEFNNGKISQEIRYKGSNPPYPKYVGMVLASILTSIYIYGDEPSGNIKYVQDVVFLENHSTIYTKDVVYRAYVQLEQGSTDNDLLLIRKNSYSNYLGILKGFISEDEDADKVFNDNNVTLELKECIKNVPLQFKLDYQQPDLNIMGEKSTVKILNIDGTTTDCISDGIKPNQLYYLDDNNKITFFNKFFRIRWLKSLKKDNDILIGEYDTTKPPTDNPYLCESLNYDEGKLGFEVSKLSSYSNGQCYCIYSYNDSYGNDLYDLLIKDILVPAARVA